MSYRSAKRFLFLLPPEDAHSISLLTLSAFPSLFAECCPPGYAGKMGMLSRSVFGIKFSNPVGMAAGFDKNADAIAAMCSMGFGFAEVGTVTPKPQRGNPKPRMFRYEQHGALQNSMGFNNKGLAHLIRRLKASYPARIPIGANVGKNKDTPQKNAMDDYLLMISEAKDLCDYLVINVSSPNTAGLRDLQNEEFISDLFSSARKQTGRPLLLKISPDLKASKAVYLCKAAMDNGASGIIATNTTVDYSIMGGSKDFGGISGLPLKEKSIAMLRELSSELYGRIPLVSVGGIFSGDDAYERIACGASLVQLYTGFIFGGPGLPLRIKTRMIDLMEKNGFESIKDLEGSSLRR